MTDVNDTPDENPETDAVEGEAPAVEDTSQADGANDADVAADIGDDAEEEGDPVVPSGRITLQELNDKTPVELVAFAEQLEIENASNLRKQDLLFAILKTLADEEVEIIASGTLEMLPDGFGFLRSPDANYLPGPDDIYVSPSQIRRFGLRSGDTVHGAVRGPREGERYFALLKVDTINYEDPETVRTKVNFDNLTPLYPNERLIMEIQDPTLRDRSGRVIDIVAPLGKGQRCLIVAPPRVGKTVMLQNIA
ncbi:MAG: Rho termination factor N-terminal domain-containing protein, partial [Pseudomonadota bacterium]